VTASDAVAVSSTVPRTAAPAAGTMIVPAGGVASYTTVRCSRADPPSSASVVTKAKVFGPSASGMAPETTPPPRPSARASPPGSCVTVAERSSTWRL